MFDIIASIKAFRAAKRAEEISPYKQLIIDIADGERPEAEEIDIVLQAANKSPEELSASVQLLIDRRGWASQVQAAKEAEQTMRSSDDQIGKLAAERDAVVGALNAKIDQLVESKRAAESLIHRSHFASVKLAETADQSIVEQEEAIAERLRELVPQQRELRYEVNWLTATLPSLDKTIATRKEAFRFCYTEDTKQFELGQIRRYTAEREGNNLRFRRLENELAEVSEEIERLQQRIIATSEKRLLP